MYLGVHCNVFPGHSYHALFTHALYGASFLCERSLVKGIWLENKVHFDCISASVAGLFLKIHNSHTILMSYEVCMVDVIGQQLKSTFLGEQWTSSTVTRLLLERFSRKFMPRTLPSWSANDANLVAIGLLRAFCLKSSGFFRLPLEGVLKIYNFIFPHLPDKRFKFGCVGH